MPWKPKSRCTKCRRLHDGTGMCPRCRPSSSARGYGAEHRSRFRPGVLAKNPWCVLCGAKATVADHYPRSRRELEERGLDPNDPRYGRGLCASCHSAETNRNQGGFQGGHR